MERNSDLACFYEFFLMDKDEFDINERVEQGIWPPYSILTTTILIETRHVMATTYSNLPLPGFQGESDFVAAIIHKYVHEHKSTIVVAQELGVSIGVVNLRLKKRGLVRTRSDAIVRDHSGRRYGRLVVLDQVWTDAGVILRECRCDCGNVIRVGLTVLRNGNTRSCGCFQKEGVAVRNWRGCGDISGNYWSRIIGNAKLRGLEVSVTLKDIWALYLAQGGRCALFNLPIGFVRDEKSRKQYQTASIDRIDSTKGYVEGNLQWVHKNINKMKGNFEDAEFVEFCVAVAAHAALKESRDG